MSDRVLMSVALLAAGLIADPAAHAAELDAPQNVTARSRAVFFNLPSQSLAESLRAVATEARISVVFDDKAVSDRRAPQLKASLTIEQAMTELLRGTGLTYQYVDDKTIVLAPAKPIAAAGVPADENAARDGGRSLRLAQSHPDSADAQVGKPGAADSQAAQDARPDVSAEASGGGQDEATVTVTASRANLYSSRVVTSGVLGDKDSLDIPFAINSYTSDLARLQGAYTPAEILKNDPSVQNPGFDIYQNNVIIRGFRSSGTVRRDGLVADGDFPIETFDRVEVIKGVTGFLYGFAEPGGMQNYVSKRPTRDFFATLNTELRNGSGQYVHLDAGGPVSDGRFGYRANVAYEDQGDFTHYGDVRRAVGAIAFDAKLSDALLLRVDAAHQQRELAGQFGLPPTPDGEAPPEYDPRNSLVPPWVRSRFKSSTVGVRADYQMAEQWQLVAQVRRDLSLRRLGFGVVTSVLENGDFEELVFTAPRSFVKDNATTAQLLALGRARSGPLEHELAFGAFYRYNDFRYFSSPSQQPATISGNLFDLSFPAAPPVNPGASHVSSPQPVTEKHVFAGDTISIGQRWQVLAGVRYVDVKLALDATKDLTVSKATPSGALLFKPRERLSLYASYARSLQYGYESPCDGDIANPCETQPPIEAEQYEVGLKARVGSSLDVGIAFFDISLPSDYLNAETRVYGRFGEQVNRGVEMTASGNIRPNLAIVAGIGYLDAKRTRNEDPSLDGNRVNGISDFTANLFLNYGITAIPGATLTAGVYHTGSRLFDLQNTISVDGYTRVDIGASYRLRAAPKGLTLRANVHNLTDQFFWEGLGYERYSAGNGRMYSLSAELQLY